MQNSTQQAYQICPVKEWYAHATVRNALRILVPSSIKEEYLFPKSRQLISQHDIIQAKGEAAVQYILAQSCYLYMYDIGLLETKFVINCALKIANGEIIINASDEMKREAMTIVIDEGYHAYVALDFITQMKEKTGIEPFFDVPKTNHNLEAVNRAYSRLPNTMHNTFELIAVCLGEHTLTKDLLSIGKEKETTQSFTQVMTDHVLDEGRHAHYFSKLLTNLWQQLDATTKVTISAILLEFIDDYLIADTERSFDRNLLKSLNLTQLECDAIISDTNKLYFQNINNYIAVTKTNLVKVLQRNGVLEYMSTNTLMNDKVVL